MIINHNCNKVNIQIYYQIFLIFLIFSPIFISLDITQGIKFDAFLDNQYKYPSAPISLFLLGLLILFNLKYLLNQKDLIIFGIILSIYLLCNSFYGNSRAFIVAGGMFLPLFSFYVFKKVFLNVKKIYEIMFLVLFVIVSIKTITDIFIYNSFFISTNSYYGMTVQKTSLLTPFYLTTSLRIYNYYDYFPFIYYLAITLSTYNVLNKKIPVISIILLIISLLVIIGSGSRLFIYGTYLIPILLVFYYFTRLKLTSYFYLFILTSCVITVLIGTVDFDLKDISLMARYNHAHLFFKDFSLNTLLFPFTNEHRINNSGSFHNEFLEIFSFFSFSLIYYYYLIKKMFITINFKYDIIGYLLMFIVLIGGLIQLNLSNPYIGIMLGFILAILNNDSENKKVTYNEKN